MRAKLRDIKLELRRRMHDPVPETGKWLGSVVKGHMQYYGVSLNWKALSSFRWRIGWLRLRSLNCRSHKANITWDRMQRYIQRWLPPPKIYHPFPSQRLGVKIQGRSPVR